MMLCFPANARYPRRFLPSTPYLLEEPCAATAALEAAIRACPPPTHFGKYPFPTYAQRAALGRCLESPFLTHREFVWLELWQVEFDTSTAARALTQLQFIISHRQATGIAPVPHKGGHFFPERTTPPQP